jgi:hypothetical protein
LASDLYLLLRQFVGDPWRHGGGIDDIDAYTWTYMHVARHRALFDRR